MHVELVTARTSDDLSLHGMRVLPPADTVADPQTAILLLHGVASNFYSGGLLSSMATSFARRASTYVINTRGHDSVYVTSRQGLPVRMGAAYERVSQCTLDVAAWVDVVRERGAERVILMGHSLGGIKTLYAASHEPQLRLDRIVAVSPPRLSFRAFQHGPQASLFMESYLEAQQAVRQGSPDQLVESRFPFPTLITAAGFLDKYGPDENYNWLNFAGRVPCPTLLTFGALELKHGGVAFAGLDQAAEHCHYESHRAECSIVEGADHFYTDRKPQLAQEIEAWLTR